MEVREALSEGRKYAVPILSGLLIAGIGIVPWVVTIRLNSRLHPEIPWAAMATLAFLIVFIAWLNGAGWPRSWRAARRYRLRLWRSGSNAWSMAGIGTTLGLIALLGLLTLIWILVGAPDRPPDLREYPSTAILVSIVIMGALVSGVVEEAAFRGYMQRGLERFGSATAIVVTSIVFALAHGVHGWQMLLFLGPGIFIASVIYGMLAYHTGSILPGMLVHFLGDLSFTFFGVLGGDWRLLIVS